MSNKSEKVTIAIESYYTKDLDGWVRYYWRVEGSNTWNVHKTALKDVPVVKLANSSTNKRKG